MTLTVQETPHDADKDNSSLLFCHPLYWLLQSGENPNTTTADKDWLENITARFKNP